MDLTAAEDIKKKWQDKQKNYTKKIFMTQIIMMVCLITHLASNILECEVKWTLGSITMNNANGGDANPVELFKIPKIDVVKYASKFGKLSSGHRTGRGQFPFQSQRKAMPKNVQTTTQLHSSHMQQSTAQNSPNQASTVHEP